LFSEYSAVFDFELGSSGTIELLEASDFGLGPLLRLTPDSDLVIDSIDDCRQSLFLIIEEPFLYSFWEFLDRGFGLDVGGPEPALVGSKRVFWIGDAMDGASFFIEFPLLGVVINDFLFEVYAFGRPFLGLIVLCASKHEIETSVVTFDQFHIEALSWLH
jgi:hypothetical protein